MDYINLDLNNIDNEHICCAISDVKHKVGVCNKKNWLKERIKEGHVFRKLNAQGKVFIEYAPLDYAWAPVFGDNFMYIYCLWVAGSYKGHGYGKELLNYAIEQAKSQGYNGICTISSKKKKPFISEKTFFIKFGFEVVDEVEDYELLALSFNEKKPYFNESVKKMEIESNNLTIYYSNQCPYVENCVDEISNYSKTNNIDINFIKIDSLDSAKNVPCIFNNWATFYNKRFVSNTLMNKNSVIKLLNK